MHSIRLRGPWQFTVEPDANPPSQPRSGQIKLPADWAELMAIQPGNAEPETDANTAAKPARVELSRSFNAPTGIDSSRIVVAVENLGPPTELQTSFTINGQQVAATINHETQSFDITPQLVQHNQLAIRVTLNPARKYFGEVTIQILDA